MFLLVCGYFYKVAVEPLMVEFRLKAGWWKTCNILLYTTGPPPLYLQGDIRDHIQSWARDNCSALRQWQRDNEIELQKQEKIRQMFKPWCLNGVATTSIEIMQKSIMCWSEIMVTLSRQCWRVLSSDHIIDSFDGERKTFAQKDPQADVFCLQWEDTL